MGQLEDTLLHRQRLASNMEKSLDNEIEKGHQVGDVSPDGKFVWTEYAPGKFDWHAINKKGKKQEEGGEKKSAKKEEPAEGKPAKEKEEKDFNESESDTTPEDKLRSHLATGKGFFEMYDKIQEEYDESGNMEEFETIFGKVAAALEKIEDSGVAVFGHKNQDQDFDSLSEKDKTKLSNLMFSAIKKHKKASGKKEVDKGKKITELFGKLDDIDYDGDNWAKEEDKVASEIGKFLSDNKMSEKEYISLRRKNGTYDGYDISFYDVVEPQWGAEALFNSIDKYAEDHDTVTQEDVDKIGSTFKSLIKRGLTEEQFDDIASQYKGLDIGSYDEYKKFKPSNRNNTYGYIFNANF